VDEDSTTTVPLGRTSPLVPRNGGKASKGASARKGSSCCLFKDLVLDAVYRMGTSYEFIPKGGAVWSQVGARATGVSELEESAQ
jgi:hypothetical protein